MSVYEYNHARFKEALKKEAQNPQDSVSTYTRKVIEILEEECKDMSPDEVFKILTMSFDEGETMKELYRSFEGKLDAENRFGYIVYENEDFYEIHSLSVYTHGTQKVRVSKSVSFDMADLAEIGRMYSEVEAGKTEGQAWFGGRWYSMETIHKIQTKYENYHWQRYVK